MTASGEAIAGSRSCRVMGMLFARTREGMIVLGDVFWAGSTHAVLTVVCRSVPAMLWLL